MLPSPVPIPKIPFDSLTLRAVAAELRASLMGGQIQDIRQPSQAELRLGIRSQGRNFILALSCDARFARVHLTTSKPPNAVVPPAFCMAVRKYCEGAVVRDVRQRGFDRILEIEIGTRAQDAESAPVVLVAELMGKHSNLILVAADGRILEAAKRVSHRINRFREVLPGLPYQAPPDQPDRLDPFDAATPSALAALLNAQPEGDTSALADELASHAAGMSPFLARSIATQLCAGGGGGACAQVWDAVFGAAARGSFRPVVISPEGHVAGAYPFPVAHIPEALQAPVPDLNAALDRAYGEAVATAGASAIASELRGQMEKDARRLRKQIEQAARTLQEGDRAEEYKQQGELVLANLWKIEPGAAAVTVQDYFDPELGDRTLTLDPKLSAQENADACFRRYRKVRDGQATAQQRHAEASEQLSRVEAAAAALEAAAADPDGAAARVREIREGLRAGGLLIQRGGDGEDSADPGPDMQGHKIRRTTSPEGYEIYIGETATANDYLTTRLAASNDIWLHVRAATSAHVVVKTQGRPEGVPRSVLEYAALLCARHSSQKHSGLVAVDYTLKKHVRKPRGAAPGSADYHHETTLHITP